MNSGIYVGTKLKYKVTITASGFDQDADDWNVRINRGKTSRTFSKSECIRGADGWYVCFDTTEFGPGAYTAVVTAFVPDGDFQDGFRTEVKKFDLEPVEAV